MKKFLYLLFSTWIYMFVYMMVQTAVNFVVILKSGSEFLGSGVNKEVFKYTFNYLPISIVVTLAIYLLIFKLKNESLIDYCDLNILLSKKYILPILILIVGFSILVGAFVQINGEMYSVKKGDIFNVIILLTFVPIFEEIMFRGIIFNKFRENIDLFSAVFIQALVFGVFHGEIIQVLYTTALGIILSIIYIWCDSIWSIIFAHQIFNLFGGVILPKALNRCRSFGVWSIWVCGVIGLLIAIWGFIKLYRASRKVKSKPYNDFFVEL